MALVHRVNINKNPLLNTFYCNPVINPRRCRMEQLAKKQSKMAMKRYMKGNELEKYCNSFQDMIRWRQLQANRTALIRINSISTLHDLEKFCDYYGKVENIFPYTTSGNMHFALLEFKSQQVVDRLRDAATYKLSNRCVHMLSPLFFYKGTVTSHIRQEYSKALKEVQPYSKFLSPELRDLKNELLSLNTVGDQMVLLYRTLKVTDLDIRLRFYTAQEVSFFLRKLYTNISVVPFGSSVNGFGQIGSDLDLLCKISDSPPNNADINPLLFLAHPYYLIERSEQVEFLQSVSVMLKTCVPGINHVRSILEARVPIIKFVNTYTNMQCDLSSTNVIALHMSELLYTYGELDMRVKPLVFTIRKWARIVGVTREVPGHWITNFSLTLLVIFYLQRKSILPPLHRLKQYTDKVNLVNLWKVSAVDSSKENLHNLLYGFFEYYSIFDFKTYGICVREGKKKSKKSDTCLLICNPFDSSLNVSQNVTHVELLRLIQHFRNALHIMVESKEQDIITKLINLSDGQHKMKSPTVQSNDARTANVDENKTNKDRTKESKSDKKFFNEGLIAKKDGNDENVRVEECIIK